MLAKKAPTVQSSPLGMDKRRRLRAKAQPVGLARHWTHTFAHHVIHNGLPQQDRLHAKLQSSPPTLGKQWCQGTKAQLWGGQAATETRPLGTAEPHADMLDQHRRNQHNIASLTDMKTWTIMSAIDTHEGTSPHELDGGRGSTSYSLPVAMVAFTPLRTLSGVGVVDHRHNAGPVLPHGDPADPNHPIGAHLCPFGPQPHGVLALDPQLLVCPCLIASHFHAHGHNDGRVLGTTLGCGASEPRQPGSAIHV